MQPYIDFSELLEKLDNSLTTQKLKHSQSQKPGKLDDLNHVIHNNKDGKYAWRPFTLIHPACYVSLVHTITEANKWKEITDRFKLFQANQQLKCFSLPVKSLTKEKDKAEQISHWREEIEQQSIQLALDFGYLFQTDIADCYSSIYTHSIAWALHGKEIIQQPQNIHRDKFIGNVIDSAIQDFSRRQTNGIPQGSTLMDFIAEMVLGYADMQLSEKIKEAQITDYQILRYRDDYRIFVNNSEEGKKILKLLSGVLMDLSLKLNPSKTTETDDLIRGSIKSDKLYWLKQKNIKLNLQDDLLRIHELSQAFPHSGSLEKALYNYQGRIEAKNNKLLCFYSLLLILSEETSSVEDLSPFVRYVCCATVIGKIKAKTINNTITLISIVVDIAFHNPRTYPKAIAILSNLLYFFTEEEQAELCEKIKKKFGQIPNTEYLELWLQRLTLKLDLGASSLSFAVLIFLCVSVHTSNSAFLIARIYTHLLGQGSPICKVVVSKKSDNSTLWNVQWLSNSLQNIVKSTSIVNKKTIEELPSVIPRSEVELFTPNDS